MQAPAPFLSVQIALFPQGEGVHGLLGASGRGAKPTKNISLSHMRSADELELCVTSYYLPVTTCVTKHPSIRFSHHLLLGFSVNIIFFFVLVVVSLVVDLVNHPE